MKIFSITDIIDSLVETVRESFDDGYNSYGYVASTMKSNTLKDELYRPTEYSDEDDED